MLPSFNRLMSLGSLVFKRTTTIMQPSIRTFFKPKPSPAVAKEKEAEADRALESENDNNNRSAKRPADDDDDDNFDHDNKTPNKRVALTPAAEKLATSDQFKEKEAKMDNKGDNIEKPQTEVVTPKKLDVPVPEVKKVSCPTPLIDIQVVIRKKISNGAFALHENIGVSWFRALQNEFDKPYFKKLSEFVRQQRQTKVVYPPENKVYTWTHHHDIKDTRVIILGQDPYHGPGQAHGLSFSVMRGVRSPPSLVNIFKELENDITDFKTPDCGDLTGWAKQGVLMLNACLSVNQGQANSHQNKGWETFTDAVISWISKNIKHKVVFLLWGRPAQRKASLIDKRHKVLTAAHPSPLSAHNGFFGCAHFSQTNKFLREQKLSEINWKAL